SVSPWIRCYHRIAVFVGYVGALAAALTLSRLSLSTHLLVRVIPPVAAALLTALGLFDQTTPFYVGKYEDRAAAFRADRQFVRGVERSLPTGVAVFQLPYVEYPEAAEVGEIHGYFQSVGYLYSDHLRWSFGTSKGRPAAVLCAATAGLSPEELVSLV